MARKVESAKREAEIRRKTKETDVAVDLRIDGSAQYSISTTVAFLDHMLELLALHGRFDLTVKATGDTAVDYHHVVDDVGICLGEAFKKALGDKKGINRYGHGRVPMDEALADVTLDFSGRPFLRYDVRVAKGRVGSFDVELAESFFSSFCTHADMTLHIQAPYGKNRHHILEAIFKAAAHALRSAVAADTRLPGVPSTKGVL
ncbi:MAG: imidazoleglycerol-phosphate dehydratase HisB [Nitrospirae bacterium]|nr:imidazoleglycerol-phosphate dehydratase HisB [Nitrospirota bacterium]